MFSCEVQLFSTSSSATAPMEPPGIHGPLSVGVVVVLFNKSPMGAF